MKNIFVFLMACVLYGFSSLSYGADYSKPHGDLFAYHWSSHWANIIPVELTKLKCDDQHNYNGVFHSDQTLYVNFGAANITAKTYVPFKIRLDVSGEGGGSWFWTDCMASMTTFVCPEEDVAIGKLSPGEHKITVTIDFDNAVNEADETNNVCERTITILP